jgi:hypothetical protein
VNTLKRQLSVANVLSCIALFVALGGAAYAAVKIPPNAIKAKNIAKQAVTNPKIKEQAVTSGKIKNGGVVAADLGAGAVINSKIANGAVTGGKLGTGAVTSNKLGKNSVTTNAIGLEQVTAGKIGPESISAAKLSASLYSQLVRNVTYVSSETPLDSEDAKTTTALCPVNKQAIGGGVRVNGELNEVAVTGSNPYSLGSLRTGWSAYARESTTIPENWSLTAFVICAEL